MIKNPTGIPHPRQLGDVAKPFLVRFAVLLLLCTLPQPAAASSLLISHGPRSQPQVALTFDLCQVPSRPAGFDRRVIDILRCTGTPATFFVGGDWLRTHPKEGAELAANRNFELGDHSWSHPDLRKLDAAAIRTQVERTETLLKRSFGHTSRLFRLPFGTYDRRVLETLAASGMRVIQWDVVSGDPDPKVSAKRMIRGVLSGVHNGSIIIMHANGRGRHTTEALPEIIRQLRRRGFTPVTVSALLNHQPQTAH